MDSMMADTPSNYNLANQRFDPATKTEKARAHTHQAMVKDNSTLRVGPGGNMIEEEDKDSDIGSD